MSQRGKLRQALAQGTQQERLGQDSAQDLGPTCLRHSQGLSGLQHRCHSTLR